MRTEKATTRGLESGPVAPEGAHSSPDSDLDELKNAGSIWTIGHLIRRFSKGFIGDVSTIADAFTAAMAGKPTGVRELFADLAAKQIKLFCGEATPEGARAAAVRAGVDLGRQEFKIFSTGDPFTFLGVPPLENLGVAAQPEDVRGRTVCVVQGDETYTPKEGEQKYDLPTLVAEALQVAFAAKANGAKKAIVVFPESLDPASRPDDRLAQLVAKLAKASGADEVIYARGLSSPSEVPNASLGLGGVGPRLGESESALGSLEGSRTMEEVDRAFKRVDLQRTALSRHADEAKKFATRAAKTLVDRVTSLLPSRSSLPVRDEPGSVVVYAGQSNPLLAERIAESIDGELGSIDTDVAGRPVAVVQTTRQDPFTVPDAKRSAMALLVEAMLLCEEAKSRGASDVTLVLPYMLNARSDKGDQKGVGAYAALVASWIDALELGKVVLVEPHDPHVPVYFRRNNVRVVSGSELLCGKILGALGGKKDVVMVRPDDGAAKRTRWLAQNLGLPLVTGDKTRADNEEHAKLHALGAKSDVDGKRCMIFDDEIATGGTMMKTIARLAENGAREVHVGVSHVNMPLDPEERFALLRKLRDAGPKAATHLYLLDTQPLGELPEDLRPFVKQISVAEAIGNEVVQAQRAESAANKAGGTASPGRNRSDPVHEAAKIGAAMTANKPKTVLLFGLSANPPTGMNGHAGIVSWGSKDLRLEVGPEDAREKVGIDETWVLPVYRHQFEAKRGLLPFHHRMEMAKLAFEHLPGLEGKVKVKDIEKKVALSMPKGERPGTIDVVRRLIAENPGTKFVLALGGDTARDLKAGLWKESEELQKLVEIVVVPRKGVEGAAGSDGAPALSEISSSAIRTSKDLSLLERELHPKVVRYLLRHRLWPFEE